MGSVAGMFKLFLLPFITLSEPPAGAFAGKTVVYRRPEGLDVWHLDLGSFDSVTAFERKVEAELPRLDVAVMNAGVASRKWAQTDGWETMLQVNGLATALLSHLLLPKLVATRMSFPDAGTPHLAVLSSDIHCDARFPERGADHILDALNDADRWEESKEDRYPVSKLFSCYLAIAIAALTPYVDAAKTERAVVVNYVAPGFCMSDLLTREEAPLALKALQYMTARTTEKGSLTILDAASRGGDTHSLWLDHQKVSKPGHLVSSEEGVRVRKKVWEEMLDALEKVDPEIRRPILC